jgi:hypothetical protein
MYPEGSTKLALAIQNRLTSILSHWGPIPSYVATSGPPWFVVDDPGRLNALTYRFECEEGHSGSFILMNARILEYVHRVALITSQAWQVEGDSLVASLLNWPTPAAVAELEGALKMFFGISNEFSVETHKEYGPLGDYDAFVGANQFAAWTFSKVSDLSQLFLMFHETAHLAPPPMIHVEPGVDVPVDRRKFWETELTCDGSGLYSLMISATQVLADLPLVSLDEAKKVGLLWAVSGTDAVLHSLLAIERLELEGEVDSTAAKTHEFFSHHPPATKRRNIASQLSVKIFEAANMSDWEAFRLSVSSQFKVRDELFSGLATSGLTIPDGVRHARWET